MSMTRRAKVKIESDGTLRGTKITDLETGKMLLVRSFYISGDAKDSELVVVIELAGGIQMDVVAEAEIEDGH